jgi:flagellar protein FliO/FliZ
LILTPRFRCALLLCLPTSLTLAQTASVETPGVSGSALLQMLSGLILIIAILFGAAYLLRRVNGGRGFGNSGPMRVVGGLMLSTRERIVLVEIGDTWLVVGIVPGQIKTLHTLAKSDLPPMDAGDKSFSQWLRQMTERKNENK